MGQIVKVKCNGTNQHVNEVDLGQALKTTVVIKSIEAPPPPLPQRVVLKCKHCTDGKVILTSKMIEEMRKQK